MAVLRLGTGSKHGGGSCHGWVACCRWDSEASVFDYECEGEDLRRFAFKVSAESSCSQRLITNVATPLPMRLVMARHSLMKRSMPTSKASDWTGTDGTAASVAASVMKPEPVTPLAPFDESMATTNNVI